MVIIILVEIIYSYNIKVRYNNTIHRVWNNQWCVLDVDEWGGLFPLGDLLLGDVRCTPGGFNEGPPVPRLKLPFCEEDHLPWMLLVEVFLGPPFELPPMTVDILLVRRLPESDVCFAGDEFFGSSFDVRAAGSPSGILDSWVVSCFQLAILSESNVLIRSSAFTPLRCFSPCKQKFWQCM